MSEFADDPLAGRDVDVLMEMGYEPIDEAGGSNISKMSAWFFGFFIFSLFLSWGFIAVADRVPGMKFTQERQPRPMMPGKDVPLLQSNATAAKDMYDLRKIEVEKSTAMGWNDAGQKSAKVPVDTAMEIVVKRGLPYKSGAPSWEEVK